MGRANLVLSASRFFLRSFVSPTTWPKKWGLLKWEWGKVSYSRQWVFFSPLREGTQDAIVASSQCPVLGSNPLSSAHAFLWITLYVSSFTGNANLRNLAAVCKWPRSFSREKNWKSIVNTFWQYQTNKLLKKCNSVLLTELTRGERLKLLTVANLRYQLGR